MGKKLTLLWAILVAAPLGAVATEAIHDEYNESLKAILPLEQGWANPPRLAKTRVWWWWLNGQTDKKAITRELEAMAASGIGGANVIDAGGDNQRGNKRVPHGPDFASPEWRELFAHAMAEAERLGLEMGFNIQSGWNLGGPMVTAEETAKTITWSEMEITGGSAVDQVLPLPKHKDGYYRDSRVVAYPLETRKMPVPRLVASSAQDKMDARLVMDGKADTSWVSSGKAAGEGPGAGKPEWLDIEFDAPVKVDRVRIVPRDGYGPKQGAVQVPDNGSLKTLLEFSMKESGVAEIAIPATMAKRFRILITASWDPKEAAARNVQVAEVGLFADGKAVAGGGAGPAGGDLKDFRQKAYFDYPGQFTASAAWHLLDPGPEVAGGADCQVDAVVDLTAMMDKNGRLRWQAPPGKWQVLRMGYTVSGAHVSTHSEGWGGYAIDYLDRTSFESYWGQVMEPILKAVRPHLGKSLRFLHTDSWELGPVNWTRLMPEQFQRLRGYDMTPYLPVLAGKVVGDRATSTRFLNDFRRTLADLMAENKYVAFSEHAHRNGLGIHPESGGPHAGPMDALRNLGISDVPMGEFWSPSPQHRVEDHQRFFVKQTTSAAHTYGRRVSLAEAFTNIGRHWQHDPRSLKATFDRAACEGHNLTMWHTFDSSPEQFGLPGAAYFAGEHLNPNVTWWPQAPAFFAYMNRCHFMLQQGLPAFDVLHFQGENIPSFVRLKRDDPAQCLPGYDYDVVDVKALMERVDVDANGQVVLPGGATYKLLSLVPHDAVSLPAMRHIAAMVERGMTLVGPRPGRQYSLSGGAAADAEFASICDKLWGDGTKGVRKVGKGRVAQGMTTRDLLQADGVKEDFTWRGGDKDTFIDFIHRRTDDTHFYYVANRNNRPETIELVFRMTGFVPEIWDPVGGTMREATRFRFENGTTVLPFPMDGEGSFFVLFRKPWTGGAARDDGPNVPELQPVQALDGSWQLAFDPAWGGPASVVFEKLQDWTTHPDNGIKYYSGAAVYRKTFMAGKTPGRVFLDLGELESLCEVKLNGKALGVLWSFPFRAEVTGLLKEGENQLEVKVVNLWANRIIGDAALPEAGRRTRTNITALKRDTPLEKSGLLGPVRLLQAVP